MNACKLYQVELTFSGTLPTTDSELPRVECEPTSYTISVQRDEGTSWYAAVFASGNWIRPTRVEGRSQTLHLSRALFTDPSELRRLADALLLAAQALEYARADYEKLELAQELWQRMTPEQRDQVLRMGAPAELNDSNPEEKAT